MKKLLEAINQDPGYSNSQLNEMALFTGMRRGELFRLEWKDIDFDKRFIHIRDPKGGSDQTIPLNDSAYQILEASPQKQKK